MKSLTLEHLNVTARKQKNDLFVEERIFDIKNLFPNDQKQQFEKINILRESLLKNVAVSYTHLTLPTTPYV